MLRPTSLFSLVVAAAAVVAVSGAAVWQPGNAQSILARSSGLHLMDAHLPRLFGGATNLQPHPTTTTTTVHHQAKARGQQPNPEPPVDITFEFDSGLRAYKGTLYVGTPPQPMAFFLDITGTETWVKNHNVDRNQFYNHTASSTYKANGTHFNVGNYYHGFWSSDDITLGHPGTHSIKMPDQLFIELTGNDKALGELAADGALGFGNGDVAYLAGSPGPIRHLINNNRLDLPIVGLYLDEQSAHTMIGGIDAMYTSGPVSHFPALPEDPSWSVPFESISVGGKPIAGAHGRAELALSWPAIIGPADQVGAIADVVGVDSGWIPCNASAPDITIQLSEDVAVTLTKKDYTMAMADNVCQFIILGLPGLQSWSFGAPFLRNVYTVLDYGKSKENAHTGIAPLRIRP